jgi:hypothetical protein
VSGVIAVWFFLFGVWPVANPEHTLGSDPWIVADVMLHGWGAWACWSMLNGWADRRGVSADDLTTEEP